MARRRDAVIAGGFENDPVYSEALLIAAGTATQQATADRITASNNHEIATDAAKDQYFDEMARISRDEGLGQAAADHAFELAIADAARIMSDSINDA